jgi:drug/metabolite transporter (DMT)-like permease
MIAAGKILFLRGLLASVILVPVVLASGAYRRAILLRHLGVFWRVFAEVISAFVYFLALFHMAIANLSAIFQFAPVTLIIAASLIFKETVEWQKWAATAAGLVGVVIVIRPGLGGFTAFSLLGVAAMLLVTLRDIVTRTLPRGLPALLVAHATTIAGCLSGPAFGLAFGETWTQPSRYSLMLIAVSVFFLVGGHITAIDFMRHGDIGVVAPFRFLSIIFAIVVGYLVWGEIPDWPMLLGSAIILIVGVYMLRWRPSLI